MLAFLFPGQGTQRVGMGQALFDGFPAAREVFWEASDTLGYDMEDLCFFGPESRLTDTEYAQPAILTCSVAALRVLTASGIKAQAVAGHSVGQFAALVGAEVLPLAEALRAVQIRGSLMARVRTRGAMSAIMGLSLAKVSAVVQEVTPCGSVDISVYNSPHQFVVSGTTVGVESLERLARAAGAFKVARLAVSQAFHSPLLTEIIPQWEETVRNLPIGVPAVPVVSDVTAAFVTDPEAIRQGLVDHLTHPVRWMQTVHTLMASGMSLAVEVGASRVLTNLNKAINRNLQTVSVETPDSLQALIAIACQDRPENVAPRTYL